MHQPRRRIAVRLFGWSRLIMILVAVDIVIVSAFGLACMIAAFGQLDGINAIAYYTPRIFAMAGYSEADSLGRTVIIGLTNLTMTLVGLALIDRVGRKPLLLVGCVTFVISHALAASISATTPKAGLCWWPDVGSSSHAFSVGTEFGHASMSCFPMPCGPRLGRGVLRDVGVQYVGELVVPGHRRGRLRLCRLRLLRLHDGDFLRPAVAVFARRTMGISLEELQKRLGIED